MLSKIVNRILFSLKRIWRDLILNIIASSTLVSDDTRFLIYRLYGLNIKTRSISPRCFIGSSKLSIGKGTFVNYQCFFNTIGEIIIGNNCNVAFQVTFCTSTHEISSQLRRAGKSISSPIIVEDGCWIGARSIILPGVTIGKGCVIGADSLVNKDCEPNGIYAGVPAKRIKELPVGDE